MQGRVKRARNSSKWTLGGHIASLTIVGALVGLPISLVTAIKNRTRSKRAINQIQDMKTSLNVYKGQLNTEIKEQSKTAIY